MSVKILQVVTKVKANSKLCLILRPIFVHFQRLLSRYVGKYNPMPTKYGGNSNVTVLPGIGIGPEITCSALEVLRAAEAPLCFEILTSTNTDSDFEDFLISIKRNKVALKANIELKHDDSFILSRNILLRKNLDLYVYVVAFNTLPGLQNKFGDIDVVLIRQNTEGEYLMLEHQPTPQSAESLKIITEYNSIRVAKFAFNYANQNKRKMITVVHNSDVHALTEGLFLQAVRSVSVGYPTISLKVMTVASAASLLVQYPKMFDVILATNLNGNLLSNCLSGMIGGPGLTAGVNLGDNEIAVFEPGARNKGSSIVGQGTANPLAMIMSGVRLPFVQIKLLEYLGYHKKAEIIKNSVFATLVYDRTHTPDLGGTATTREITNKIVEHVKQQLLSRVKLKDRNVQSRWRNYCDAPKVTDQGKKKRK